MVAISLYRGNLHKVPDVPREWPRPSHPFSVKRFKSLLSRRSKLSSRNCSSSANPNSDPQEPVPNHNQSNVEEGIRKDKDVTKKEVKEEQVEQLDGDNRFEKPVDGSNSVSVLALVEANDVPDSMIGNLQSHALPKEEKANDKMDAKNEKENRKKEVEEKLKILNARKHNLVQVLKQIINVEEELKRRNSMHPLASIRPPVPLQVDVTTDSTPRMGSGSNLGGDMEGVETDDASNHNMHSRGLFRKSSRSPTADSSLKRPAYFQHNPVPHLSRATTFGASASPSRFSPLGPQGHAANAPTVSVSGTNYVASSPSPAASGGTSVFRDGRHPSPWNY